MSQTITKLYDIYADASLAVQELERNDFSRDDISIVANNEHEKSHAAADAGIGATAGATIGGAGGVLTGLGLLAIPGVGPVVAAGWLAAAAAGAGVGAIIGGGAGGIIGALQKDGVSEDDAHLYAEGIRRGGALVSVRTSSERADQARAILDGFRPVDAVGRRSSYQDRGWSKFDDSAAAYDANQIDEERSLYLPR